MRPKTNYWPSQKNVGNINDTTIQLRGTELCRAARKFSSTKHFCGLFNLVFPWLSGHPQNVFRAKKRRTNANNFRYQRCAFSSDDRGYRLRCPICLVDLRCNTNPKMDRRKEDGSSFENPSRNAITIQKIEWK